jgi:hypothetical protein
MMRVVILLLFASVCKFLFIISGGSPNPGYAGEYVADIAASFPGVCKSPPGSLELIP